MHPIPFAALDGKVGVMGVTGSGKTFTAIGLTEQLLDAGRQVIIIDPTGVYNGLRTVYPLPIFGGRFGDVEISETSGEAVAHLIIDRGLSAIIDVSALLKKSHAAARRFMAPFVATLKNAPIAARYIVMDEADEFMPEHASGDIAYLFGDLKWIVRRGRSSGWRMLMVTQRPQDIAKSVLTQCETMVIHRLMAPQDRKALLEWVKGNADAEQAKAVLDSLATLGTGEAWVWSPSHNLLDRVKMPANRSEDRSKTPDADDRPRAAIGFQAVDLAGLREALAAPEGLGPNGSADNGLAAKQAAEEIGRLQADRDYWRDLATTRGVLILRARAALQANGDELQGSPGVAGGVPGGDDGQKMVASVPAAAEKPQLERERPSRTKPQGVTAGETALRASPAAIAMIDMLDRMNPARVTWSQAATMTGRKASGGNFNAARKWLRESGRIVEDGEFIRSASDAPAGLSRADAIALWSSVLTNPAPRMLEALVTGPLDKDTLAASLGVKPTGGNWNNGLAQLRRNGVAIVEGDLVRLARPLPGEAA